MVPTSFTSDPIIESSPSTHSARNNVIDATHLYYIHPSDYPRMILVSIVFDRKSYGGWRRVTNGEKLFQLQMELNVVVQCNSSISDYFTKIKICVCDCGAKAKLLKFHQDGRLLQFLTSLNESFVGVRSNIFFNEKSIILMSIQRALHLLYPSFKPPKGSVKSKKNSSTSAYCKKLGHSIDKCYIIHGFSPDFKFTKEKRFQTLADNAYHAVEEVDQGGSGFSNGKTLTQENIAEFLQLLQQLKLG
ncbi:hypothetical protein R3W88_011807 [Solanum pinnatisectum]|uniref:Uncharacterized protein n=1 Tax=Solanum pinnatisectum TaxID=50273 RepID=A0AAV9L8B1_9SOLN|nr:hypothetical protein R3W88_011807 [Solanum pinnatisectum]